KIAYIANEQLYLRNLDAIEARPIQGIQEEIQSPFFSPDGEWIGFWSWTEGGILKKIAVGGGSAVTLCKATSPFGICWWEDNTILFGQGQNVMRVSANGGTPEVLLRSKPDELIFLSQVLPGGKAALLSVTSGSGTWDKARIVAASLESGERKVIIEQGGGIARYIPTGHLVYVSGTTLYAAPLDLHRLEVGAGSVPVLSGLMPSRGLTSVIQYCFSDPGSLIYAPSFVTNRRLIWVDSRGIVTPLAAEERNYAQVRFSPDCGKAAAAIQNDEGVWEIWILDLGEKPSFKLAVGSHPVWTPDGRRIIFHSTSTGDICWIPADGSTLEPEVLLERSSPQFPFPWSCSPDGKTLFFYENPNFDIGVLKLDGEGRPEYAIRTDFYEGQPAISPDGRRIAYVSNRSGSRGIWVRSYPEPGAPVLISPSGEDPVWSRDGRRLFFRTSDKMMSVAIEVGQEFRFRPAETLFTGRYHFGWFPNYDYSRDGRFIMIQQVSTSAEIIVVLNWFEELKRLVPTGK
ncbi:MAG: hypothetical protein ABIG68_11830, partial [Acidobacteriota bacterium]